MANLTSTVPGAFNTLYTLLAAAGAGQSPPIPVFHSEIIRGQYTQGGYVLLESVQDHEFEIAALGSYAQYETYDIHGSVSYYQGGPDPVTLVEAVLNQTWSIYAAVVMTTVVANRGVPGQPVLGSGGPVQLLEIVPKFANYSGAPADIGGDASGFVGTVEFAYWLKGRLTVA